MSTMAKRIHDKRVECNLTQEELGKKLNPPVKRAAICKWENGGVSDIKRSHIQQMANIFHCDPVWLMALDGAKEVSLTYEAPDKEPVKLMVDHEPIIGRTSKIAELYAALLALKPENYDVALKILKSLT